MKKSILILAAVFTFSAFFTSCREVNEEKTEVEISDDMDDLGDDIEDAADDVGDAVNEGIDEVKENTGTGGTDDL
ncbi:hypothetical protein ACKGJN_12165 [Gillisia sp. Q332]|uniref:hypothetical protein n=1 Tax=Gillisia xinjiangensis TaxID=3384765 RepID=UPI00391C6923